MNFFIVLLFDGHEWRRGYFAVNGEPTLGDVARRVLDEWRTEHPTEHALDRLSIRIDKEPT